jgi:glutathione synthase
MDNIENINIYKDTTFILMLESQKRNFVYYCILKNLVLYNNIAYAKIARVQFSKNKKRWYKLNNFKFISINYFDLIFIRKDPPINSLFTTITMMLEFYNNKKTLIINNPTAIRIVNEKLFTHKLEKFIPKTIIGCNKKIIIEVINNFTTAILKPLFSSSGDQIVIINKNDKNINSILEILTKKYKQIIIIQKWIQEIKNGDKRILLLNGNPIGSIFRLPGKKDFRANIHVGGIIKKSNIENNEYFIIKNLKSLLSKFNINFAGIDIIGNYITEINITSPTCLQEINETNKNNKNLTKKVISRIEKIHTNMLYKLKSSN